jgi:hypothetical protein
MDLRGGFVHSFIQHRVGNFMGPSPELLRNSGGAGERCIQSARTVPRRRENTHTKIVPRERAYKCS